MLVPLSQEARDELRREINSQVPEGYACLAPAGRPKRVGAAPQGQELLFWGDRDGEARTGTARQQSRSSAYPPGRRRDDARQRMRLHRANEFVKCKTFSPTLRFYFPCSPKPCIAGLPYEVRPDV